MKSLILSLFLFIPLTINAQKTEDFFYLEAEDYEFPVFVRGNSESEKLILFVQGGPGETAIDFARSDYPSWEHTLEKEFLIAYYDQRGLNQNIKKIDTTKINYRQYSKDIIAIGKNLQQRYDVDIYLMGHSAGGKMVLNTLQNYTQEIAFINAAMILNTPITTDFSSERWTHFRPLYLENLAKEKIENNINTDYWQEAYDWITETDSITTPGQARRWNDYVDAAFTPKERKITPGMFFSVIFSRPYNPISYFKSKDNELVSDLLWENGKKLTSFADLNKITVPVLLLTGQFDDVGSPEENHQAHELIPKSSLFIVSDAGHESFLDQPEIFNQEIIRFISNN